MASTLPQHEIECPAATDVRSGRAEVGKQFGVGATGVFQGVGEKR
jgi:hypothetical protein